MNEKVIQKKDWEYIVLDRNGSIILKVLCGGSAMYEVEYILSEEDIIQAKSIESFYDALAKKIRDNPSKYKFSS